jgi:hypothetical protein
MYFQSGWETLVQPKDTWPTVVRKFITGQPKRSFYPELVLVAPNTDDFPTDEHGFYQSIENITWVESKAAESYDVSINLISGSVITYPEPAILTAQVNKVIPIVGATISSDFLAPDGSIGLLELFDDGKPPDFMASDGVFTGYLLANQEGAYTISVNANNETTDAFFSTVSAAHSIGPNGETWLPENTPVEEVFTSSASLTVSVTGVQPDDHGDTPGSATALATGNIGVWGRMDRAGDVDVFQITPATDGILSIRLTNLGLGFKPHVDILAADGVTILSTYDFEPNNVVYFNTLVSSLVGVPFYVSVTHTEGAASGFYMISAGESLPTDQQLSQIYLPLIR